MIEIYGCQLNQEHNACIKEASELINTMSFKPDARVWGPLLNACKMHSETRLAGLAAEKLTAIEPKTQESPIHMLQQESVTELLR